MSKRAFVTGATGFLGINLVQELLAQNWQVTAIKRSRSQTKYLDPLNINLVTGDVENVDSLRAAVPHQVDAVFHVAASTNLWSKYNQRQYKTNVEGTRNIIKVALEKEAGRFIHTSSIAAYGIHQDQVREDTLSNALDSGINYHVTKYLSENDVKQAVSGELDAVVLNPAHIVGPYDTHNWVQIFKNVYRQSMPGIPPTLGCFTYAPEVAKVHIKAYEKGVKGENYLLGGVEASMLEFVNFIERFLDKPISMKTTAPWILQLATKLYQLGALFTGKEPLLTPEKTKLLTHNVRCDDSKARQQLDFQAVPLETIVEKTCHWLKQENLL